MAGLTSTSEDQIDKSLLGVFGGSFDPPHIAHLILAAEALQALQLKHVLWVLTPVPPHKTDRNLSSLDLRLRMLRAAIQDNPAFELSNSDIDRQPPYYAVDTLRLLQVKYPQAGLVYLMGGDSLRDLPGWHAPAEFVTACAAIGVMRRPGDQLERQVPSDIPGLATRLRFFSVPQIEISSSDIRARVAEGRNIRYLVPDSVAEIIAESGLYRS